MIFGFNTDVKFGTTVYHVQSEAREHDHLLQTQVFVKGRCLGKYAKSFADQAGQPDFSEDHLHDLLKAQHKHFVESARAGTIETDIDAPSAAPLPEPTQAAAAPAPSASPAAAAVPPEEERISISLTDDPDLAAIAEASAAAMTEERKAAPVAPMPIPEEAQAPPVEAPPDPMLDSFMAELEAAEKAPPPPPLVQYRVEAAGSVIGKGIDLECLEPIVAPDGTSVLLNVTVAEAGAPSPDAQITCRISVVNAPAAYVYAKSNDAGVADVRISTRGLDAMTGVLIQAAVRGKTASRKFNLKRT